MMIMLGDVRLRNTKHYHHTKDHISSSSFSGLLTQHHHRAGLKTNGLLPVLAYPTPPHITKHQFKFKKIYHCLR